MRIRTASIEDAKAIAGVHIASWRAIYHGHFPDSVLEALDLEQRTGQWRHVLSLPDVECIVAESPPIIGFSTLAPGRDPDLGQNAGEITAIYLHPDHWRLGIGRKLLAAAAVHAQERGYQALSLWVLRENQRARSFYEALGFSRDGKERTDTRLIGVPLYELRYVRPVASGPTTRCS